MVHYNVNKLFLMVASVAIIFTASSRLDAAVSAAIIPSTAQEHMSMAKNYEEKAKQYEAEAQMHRRMKESYASSVATSPRSPVKNPWIEKMDKHCDEYIRSADSMAQEARRFAEFHKMRAEELRAAK